jgi:lysozyme
MVLSMSKEKQFISVPASQRWDTFAAQGVYDESSHAQKATGNRGLGIIKRYEGLRLRAYRPTPDDVWTIGWGHTRGVSEGDMCTKAQAEVWLQEDIEQAEDAVNGLRVELSQGMFDALVSLVYNVGPGALTRDSTIGHSLRSREYFHAWAGFALWRKQGGRDRRGLARRRAQEMALFMEDPLPDSD